MPARSDWRVLLDIHDRMRHREAILRRTYNLPLSQEQISDCLGLTLVHVNRTLRRLREDGLANVDRQVVIIRDIDRLSERVRGLPEWTVTLPASLLAQSPR